jgi:hypothetical protein
MLRGTNILENRFVEIIEENHQAISEQFMNDLLKNPETASYRNADRQKIYEGADRIYRELSKWIVKEYSKSEVAAYYRKIGQQWFDQGIPFSQAHKALVLQRRHLWLFILDKLYYDASLYKEALDLNNRVVLYFDRAIFAMLEGYETRIYKKW